MAEEPERQLAAAQQSCNQLQQQLLEQQQRAEQVSLSFSDPPFQDPLLHLQVLHAALQRLDKSVAYFKLLTCCPLGLPRPSDA